MTDEELLAQADSLEGEFQHRAALHDHFRYDKSQDAFWDIETMQLLKPTAVNASIPVGEWETKEKANGELVPIPPAKTIANVDTGLVVETASWWPGKPREMRNMFVSSNGARKVMGATTLNLYTPPEELNSRGQTAELWLAHVKKLYPDPEEHNHFLDYAADMIQNPGRKPQHGILLAGQQGIGKDAMLLPLRRGSGPGNSAGIDPDDLFSNFNPWQKSVMLVIDEVRPHPNAGRATDFYNKCKTLLANAGDMAPVDIKHVSTFYVPNVLRVFFTANEPKSMYIPPEDRRIFVMTSLLPDPKVNDVFGEDYFDDLFGYFNSGGWDACVMWLQNRDISNFKHGKAPPQTYGKSQIIESAKASRWSLIDEVVAGFAERGFNDALPDVIFPADLIAFINGPQGLFDDADEAIKKVKAASFHYKMDERGYDIARNPDAARWRNKGFQSRLAFVKKSIPIDGRTEAVNKALKLRPLSWGPTEVKMVDGKVETERKEEKF